MLVYGTRILLQKKVSFGEIKTAEKLLHLFVENMETIYGLEKCSFNIHQLIHICVRKFGPLWVWSTFTFEDSIGYFNTAGKIKEPSRIRSMRIVLGVFFRGTVTCHASSFSMIPSNFSMLSMYGVTARRVSSCFMQLLVLVRNPYVPFARCLGKEIDFY